ncbi:hypothetical protein BGZ83_006762 [Gryganskiella cystojenkinii]|nr:hypothetical protein BGZ83_006762 [Gryganskiella cystojenkinii]
MGRSAPALGDSTYRSSQPFIQIVRPSSAASFIPPSSSASILKSHDKSHISKTPVARKCGFVYSLIEGCYNRATAWLLPNEPEPLDLQSTLFFIAQAPFIGLVFLQWIPLIASWFLGFRASQAGDLGPAQGMRRAWSVRLALSLSFLKMYLRFAENLSIEDCQSRSRSIPFMTAPAGIRVQKVKIPAFPWRPRAEAILDQNLTEQDRSLLHKSFSSQTLVNEAMQGVMQDTMHEDADSTTGNNNDYDCATYCSHISRRTTQSTDQFAEGLDAEWLEYTHTNSAEDQESFTIENVATVLYFHGGGYYTGSKEEHRVLIGPLVKGLGRHIRILIINYRLAPQHPFPAALVDALSSYLWLLEQPISDTFPLERTSGTIEQEHLWQPSQIVFMGDSAGGGLALSLSLLLRDHGSLPQPKAIVTWSPWVDLTQALPSFKDNAMTDCIPYEDFVHRHSTAVDAMFDDSEECNQPRQRAQVYCPDSCLRMKYVSPIYETDFRGIPEVFIVCGSAERFANECVLLASRLEQQQITCRLDIHEDMPHIFPLFRFHPSAAAGVARTSAYIRTAVGHESHRDEVVIPMASTPSSSSLSSQQSSPPSIVSRLFEATVPAARATASYSLVPTNDFGQESTIGYQLPDLLRINSSSSVSSVQSDDSTVAYSSEEKGFGQGTSRKATTFDPQNMKNKGPSRCKVNVIDLSGVSILSFHNQRRASQVAEDGLGMERSDSPSLRQRRSGRAQQPCKQELVIQDLASDETLKEWESMLLRGYIPKRIWPHPPKVP